MSAFVSGMRGAFLYLSRQPNLRRFLETSPEARTLTSRFIAGLTLEDGMRVVRELDARGVMTSLDHLGENVTTEAEALDAKDQYVAALRRIADAKLPATISMKLTSLGLDVSEELCRANTDELVRTARDLGTAVECDMEDSRYTERSVAILSEMHRKYAAVRAVLQAYLYRTEADVAGLNARAVPIRLCKGAYREPPDVAFPDKEDVDRNYVKLMKLLLERGTYPAIATHDERIVGQCIEHVRTHNIQPQRFEFQMLYGVRRKLQRQIVARGFRLRLYVPYGSAWYPYFMRRLAERPANVLFLAKSLAQD